MTETTETLCHWEQVQRQWKWEWASYHPHDPVYWTAGDGTTELLDEAALAAEPPALLADHAFGSRWEKVSGTGTNVVVATADLPEGQSPAGEGWRLAETVTP